MVRTSGEAADQPLLEVQDLRTYLFTRAGVVKAVDGVSFSLRRGESLGLVGESGSGKSMTCLSLMQLLPRPVGRIVSGSIRFDGEELVGKSSDEMRAYRGRRMSMILQDPMTSLNPVFTIGDQVGEAVQVRYGDDISGLWERVIAALRAVKIPAAEHRVNDFPHQMSGGMRQRVVGAMPVAQDVELLIADEPTTALDVTIQGEFLALLREIQQERKLAIIFVTHDLGVVAQMCDRVAVMYAGRLVELADVLDIFDRPGHPYTRALLDSVPTVERKAERLISIDGQPPDLAHLAPGCSFAPRCPHAMDRCREVDPPAISVTDGHWARCWLLAS
jgi:oligopeptide/dipeptide ABC transporter ATP-binding protein